jgi:hypothetical protein
MEKIPTTIIDGSKRTTAAMFDLTEERALQLIHLLAKKTKDVYEADVMDISKVIAIALETGESIQEQVFCLFQNAANVGVISSRQGMFGVRRIKM